MFDKRIFENNNTIMQYVIDFPKDFDASKKYPIILYFHGMGMVQNGIQKVIDRVPVRRERMTDNMPFIIVAPYCEYYTWIECFEQLTDFVDYIIKQDYTDKKKSIYNGFKYGWLYLLGAGGNVS